MEPDEAEPTVLVVDDDRESCRLMLRILRSRKVKGHCIENGRDALEWLSVHRPRLILLDVSMPDMSGPEVLQQIRKHSAFDDIFVVFHSALDAAELNALAKTYNANGTLPKGRYTMADVVGLLHRFGVSVA